MKKFHVIVAIVATVAVAFGVFLVTRTIISTGSKHAGPPVAFTAGADAVRPVQVKGNALPRYADPTKDKAIGQPFPPLEGSDFSGHSVIVGPGKPTILVVVSHWCAVCQRTIPELVSEMHQKKINPAVRIVVLSTSASTDSPNWPPQTWLQHLGWTGETLVDNNQSLAALSIGAPSYPFFVGTNSAGVVVFRSSGDVSPSNLEQLATLVASS